MRTTYITSIEYAIDHTTGNCRKAWAQARRGGVQLKRTEKNVLENTWAWYQRV
jgi:hypothetical protein